MPREYNIADLARAAQQAGISPLEASIAVIRALTQNNPRDVSITQGGDAIRLSDRAEAAAQRAIAERRRGGR